MSRKIRITEDYVSKEEEKLRELEMKLEKQKAYVADLKQQLILKEFTEAENVLSAKGLSIKQILSAVERGDLNDLLAKKEQ